MGINNVTGLRVRVDMTGTKYDRHLDEECDSGNDAIRRVVEFFDRDEDTEQRAWEVITEVRDAAPRLPSDAATADIVDALVKAGLLR